MIITINLTVEGLSRQTSWGGMSTETWPRTRRDAMDACRNALGHVHARETRSPGYRSSIFYEPSSRTTEKGRTGGVAGGSGGREGLRNGRSLLGCSALTSSRSGPRREGWRLFAVIPLHNSIEFYAFGHVRHVPGCEGDPARRCHASTRKPRSRAPARWRLARRPRCRASAASTHAWQVPSAARLPFAGAPAGSHPVGIPAS